jgi:hypothetical protein
LGGGLRFLGRVFAFFGELLLEREEFGDVGFALVAEAALLQSGIGQFFAVDEEGLSMDERFAIVWIRIVGELVGEFAAADGVDAGFERSDAEEAPVSIGDELD